MGVHSIENFQYTKAKELKEKHLDIGREPTLEEACGILNYITSLNEKKCKWIEKQNRVGERMLDAFKEGDMERYHEIEESNRGIIRGSMALSDKSQTYWAYKTLIEYIERRVILIENAEKVYQVSKEAWNEMKDAWQASEDGKKSIKRGRGRHRKERITTLKGEIMGELIRRLSMLPEKFAGLSMDLGKLLEDFSRLLKEDKRNEEEILERIRKVQEGMDKTKERIEEFLKNSEKIDLEKIVKETKSICVEETNEMYQMIKQRRLSEDNKHEKVMIESRMSWHRLHVKPEVTPEMWRFEEKCWKAIPSMEKYWDRFRAVFPRTSATLYFIEIIRSGATDYIKNFGHRDKEMDEPSHTYLAMYADLRRDFLPLDNAFGFRIKPFEPGTLEFGWEQKEKQVIIFEEEDFDGQVKNRIHYDGFLQYLELMNEKQGKSLKVCFWDELEVNKMGYERDGEKLKEYMDDGDSPRWEPIYRTKCPRSLRLRRKVTRAIQTSGWTFNVKWGFLNAYTDLITVAKEFDQYLLNEFKPASGIGDLISIGAEIGKLLDKAWRYGKDGQHRNEDPKLILTNIADLLTAASFLELKALEFIKEGIREMLYIYKEDAIIYIYRSMLCKPGTFKFGRMIYNVDYKEVKTLEKLSKNKWTLATLLEINKRKANPRLPGKIKAYMEAVFRGYEIGDYIEEVFDTARRSLTAHGKKTRRRRM